MFRVKPTIITIFSLTLSLAFVFFWLNSALSPYSLQLIAVLTIIFLLSHKFLTKNKLIRGNINLVIFSITILILVSETGGLDSPLFFLIYFLLFGVAFLSSTPAILSLTLAIILFFSSSLETINAVIQLVSLLLITPLAIIFSKQYLRLLEQRGEINILQKEKEKTEKSLENQETTALMWISLNLKNKLTQVSDYLSQLLSDISHLSPSQQQLLKKTHQKIHDIIRESQNVQETIDKETD